MERIIVNQYKKPKLNNPVLIGGLPGIGNVGKIAAEYLIEKLKMEKLADVFSQYLPPQVFIDDNSVVKLVRNSLYYKKFPKKNDLLVLVGDFQGTTQASRELSRASLTIMNSDFCGLSKPRIWRFFSKNSDIDASLNSETLAFPAGITFA